MKTIKTIVVLTIIASAIIVSYSVHALDLLDRLNTVSDKMGYSTMDPNELAEEPGGAMGRIAGAFGVILNWTLAFLGVIFMGLIIYAGFRWMTARGNEQQVADSKNIIINSSIGVLIVAIAYAFTLFIGYIVEGVGLFRG